MSRFALLVGWKVFFEPIENRMIDSGRFSSHFQTYEALCKEKEYLENLAEIIAESLSCAPKGSLRVAGSKSGAQYYHKSTEYKVQPKHGVYIKKENRALASRLAQKGNDG